MVGRTGCSTLEGWTESPTAHKICGSSVWAAPSAVHPKRGIHLDRAPCFGAFEHHYYMLKQDTSFASMDFCVVRRDKMLTFAWSLQEWAEQSCTGTAPSNLDVGCRGLHPEWYPTSPKGEASVRAEGAAGANSITPIRNGTKIRVRGPIPGASRWRVIADGR